MTLAGRVAVVTGTASGIGAATAHMLEKRGATVAGFDISQDPVAERFFCQIDVTSPDDVRAAIEQVDHRFGRIDMLVNGVGGGEGYRVKELMPESWHQLIDLNLTSAFNTIHAAIPVMKRIGGGAIVNVASLAAWRVSPKGGAAYAAAKAGMLALSRQCAHELAPDRIRVNSVLPGAVRTALTANSSRTDADFLLGRWLRGEDIAQAICFLLSDEASMCTGAELLVDGGESVK